MKNINLIGVVSVGFLFLFQSIQAKAVQHTVILPDQWQDGLGMEWAYSSFAPKMPITPFPPYTEASRLLFLSDGFFKDETSDNSSENFSLAEFVEKIASADAKIYKTSLDCPNERSGTTSGKISYLKIDNTQVFPFEDNFFDTIVLKKGLCYCEHSSKTCAGLEFGTDTAEQFFREIVRVINKKNPRSVAYLQGMFRAHRGMGLADSKQEKLALGALEALLDVLEVENENLKFEMIFREDKIGLFLFSLGIQENRLFDEIGDPLTQTLDFTDKTNFHKTIRYFDGVRISIRR